MLRNTYVAAAVALVALGGCAHSNTISAERMAAPRASIRAAQENGAQSNPQAALYLKLAQEEVARADALIRDGDRDEAARMLWRAEADAELAVALAKGTNAQREAAEAQAKIQELSTRQQTGR
jgi:hypothetical protein